MAISNAQMKALLARLEKPIRDAFLASIAQARSFAKIKALMAAIESGNVDTIMAAVGMRESLFTQMTESVRAAYLEGGSAALSSTLPKRLALNFDMNNPRAVDWLRTQSASKVAEMLNQQRAAIQIMLTDGMRRGDNPLSVALDIAGRIGPSGRRTGGVLGLTEHQAGYVTNLRNDLEMLHLPDADDARERYFNRKLRDRRFDSVVRKSIADGKPVPKKTRLRMVERYEDRWLKHRADTIGRTEMIRATSEASSEAMRQVVDEGLTTKEAIKKVWKHSYGKDARPGHYALNNIAKPIDDPFQNPVTFAYLMYPGDPAGGAGEVINCRCWLDHRIDYFAIEQDAVA